MTFEMRVPLLYRRLCKKYKSFLNEITCRVSAKPLFVYRSMIFYDRFLLSELA